MNKKKKKLTSIKLMKIIISPNYLFDCSSSLEELLSLLSELLDFDLPLRCISFLIGISAIVLLVFSSGKIFLSFGFSFTSLVERSGDFFTSLTRSNDERVSLERDRRSLSPRLSLERSRLLDLSRDNDLSYLFERSRPSGERRLFRRSGDLRRSRRSDDRRLRSGDRRLRLSPGLGDRRRYRKGLLRGGLLLIK